MQLISVPKPCHEDWNNMSPADQGRHCDVCAKTVTDFTAWQPQQILFYLQQHAAQKTCGRFLPAQLEEPIPTPEDFVKKIGHFSMPYLKKAAAILLFSFSAFMVSCTDAVLGKIAKAPTVIIDTPPPIQTFMGDSVVMPLPAAVPLKTCRLQKTDSIGIKTDVAVLRERQLLGEPAFIIKDTILKQVKDKTVQPLRVTDAADNARGLMLGEVIPVPSGNRTKKGP